MQQTQSPQANAAADFAVGIRSRRDLLQTLYYATRNSAAEAWALHQRLQTLQEDRENGMVAVNPGDVMPRFDVYNAKRVAEATAQDSALAFVLIVDYALQRLRRIIAPTDTRTLGPELPSGVKLNAMIWVLANQARHAHAWEARDDAALEAQEEVQIIRALQHDPRNLNVAREIICALPVNSYIEIEEALLSTAHEVARGTGYHFGMIAAGVARLDPDRH